MREILFVDPIAYHGTKVDTLAIEYHKPMGDCVKIHTTAGETMTVNRENVAGFTDE